MVYCVYQAAMTPILGGDSTRTLFTAPFIYIHDGVQMVEWFYPLQVYGMLLQVQLMIDHLGTPVVSAVFMALTALYVYYLGDKYARNAGPLAMALYLSIHMVRIVAYYGLNEHLFTLVVLVGIHAMLERRYWLSGVAFGAALGIDYVAVPMLAGILLFCTVTDRVKALLPILVMSVIVAIPWYLPNWLTYGNIFWPYFDQRVMNDMVVAATSSPHRLEFGWAFLVMLPALLFAEKRSRTWTWLALASGVVVCLALKSMHSRYILPSLAMLCIPMASGFMEFCEGIYIIASGDVEESEAAELKSWLDTCRNTAVAWLMVYIVFVTAAVVPYSVPKNTVERTQILAQFYPCYDSVGHIAATHPYAKVWLTQEMSSYRYYTRNEIVADIQDADFAITPYRAYRMWIPIERLQIWRELREGKWITYNRATLQWLSRTGELAVLLEEWPPDD